MISDLLGDALANPPFTQFIADHRPLGPTLAQFGQLAISSIHATKTLVDLERIESSLHVLLASVRPQSPELAGGGHGSVQEGEFWGPAHDDGSRPALTRFWFRRQILGAAGLLIRWPSECSVPVIDRDSEHPYLAAGEAVWIVRPIDGDDDWALYTPIDLTHEELEQVHAGQLSVQKIYDDREALIIPIVDAIRAETADYFDVKLPKLAQEALESRRLKLAAFSSVTTGVAFPNEWRLKTPEVTPTTESIDPESTRSVTTPLFRDRLAEASFEELQRAIRVWANAVERYPAAFSALDEERVSDLLAATLHASLPGADREVFSRRGKTDIQVRAKALDDGSSEARVFIAETKWATGSRVVREALDPQLFSYLNSADTAAVLLLLFRQQNRVAAYSRHLPVLKAVPGFEAEEASAVQGWKINRYRRDGKELRLLIATVHIPPTKPLGV